MFMKKYKIHQVKNEKLKIIWAIVCIVVLILFITWVVVWAIWWYKYDITLMKTWILVSVISWMFMWILHIIYFRTSKNFRKKLFGE